MNSRAQRRGYTNGQTVHTPALDHDRDLLWAIFSHGHVFVRMPERHSYLQPPGGLHGVVIGRKNHYGSRSQRGTEVAALLYSLIESAKLAGVGPHTYLRAATHAALRGHAVLLPHQLA